MNSKLSSEENKSDYYLQKNLKDNKNKYFKDIKKEILELHIAHNEGNYFCSYDEMK